MNGIVLDVKSKPKIKILKQARLQQMFANAPAKVQPPPVSAAEQKQLDDDWAARKTVHEIVPRYLLINENPLFRIVGVNFLISIGF